MLPKDLADRSPAPHALDLFLAEPELPYFAEYATFCWGRADYESRGDCRRPTDRSWTWLELTSRATRDRVLVFRSEAAETPERFPHPVRIEATAARPAWLSAYLTMRRTPAVAWLRRRGHHVGYGALAQNYLLDEDVEARWERSAPVRGQFEMECLRPYDTMEWWSGWKWEGNFSSRSAWPKRELMHAVATGKRGALPNLLDSLIAGIEPGARGGYFHALRRLTGERFETEEQWIEWWRKARRDR